MKSSRSVFEKQKYITRTVELAKSLKILPQDDFHHQIPSFFQILAKLFVQGVHSFKQKFIKYGLYGSIRGRKFNGYIKIPKLTVDHPTGEPIQGAWLCKELSRELKR